MPGKELQQFLNKLEGLYKTAEFNLELTSLDGVRKGVYTDNKAHKYRIGFFDNVINKISKDDMLDKYIPSLKGLAKERFANKFASDLFSIIGKNNVEYKNRLKEISDEKNINKKIDKATEFCKEYLSDNEANKFEEIKKCFVSSNLIVYTSFNKFEEFENLINHYSFLGDDKLLECIPSEPITPAEDHSIEEEYMKLEEINELKKNINDNELLNILDDANEILKIAKPAYSQLSSNIAEKYGVKRDAYKVDNAEKVFKANGFKQSEIIKSKRHIYIKKDEKDSVNNNKLVYDTIEENELSDKAQADELKDICKTMIESGIFEPGPRAAEQGNKLYAFSKLISVKDKLEEAVNKKDIEGIKQYQSEYRNLENVYDSLLDRLNKINDNKEIVSNVSPAREESVPEKYRNDVVGASRLSALFISMSFFSLNNIDINKAIDDPLKEINNFAGNMIHTDSKVLQACKNDYSISKIVFESASSINGFRGESNYDVGNIDGLERSFDAINVCLNDDNRARMYHQFIKLGSSSIESMSTMVTGTDAGLGEKSEEYIKNMMFCKKEDFNIYLLNPKNSKYFDPKTGNIEKGFDRAKYFKEHDNIYEVLHNMDELTEFGKDIEIFPEDDINQTVINAIKSGAKELSKSKHKMSFIEGKIVDDFKKGNKTNPHNMTLLKIEHNKLDYTKEADQKAALDAYAYMKKEYENSNGFKKIFFPSVRKLNKLNTEIMNKLMENGISEDRINNHLASFEYKKYENEKIRDYQNNPIEIEEVLEEVNPIEIESEAFENKVNDKNIEIDNTKVSSNNLVHEEELNNEDNDIHLN